MDRFTHTHKQRRHQSHIAFKCGACDPPQMLINIGETTTNSNYLSLKSHTHPVDFYGKTSVQAS
jgi:hypothetical protein